MLLRRVFEPVRLCSFMRVFITGTPGTGKSSLAAAIGDRFSIPVFNVALKAKLMGLVESHDEERDADVIDEASIERIAQAIERKHDDFVLEGHLVHYAAPREGDGVVMICAMCPIEILKDRLEERGYSEAKVRDNLDSEIFQVCRTEAEEAGWEVLLYDSSKLEPDEFARDLSDR
jgi:adenylate kinase